MVERVTDNQNYFGVLQDIIELHIWVNISIDLEKELETDDHRITSVNVTYTFATNKPFVLSC